MAKRITCIIALLFSIFAGGMLVACSKQTHTVIYSATMGGNVYYIDDDGNEILGTDACYVNDDGDEIFFDTEFSVKTGEDVTAITAKPYDDYIFDKWSDGVTTATRQDTDVSSSFNITAIFKKEEFTLEFIAGEHGSIDGETIQIVAYKEYSDTVTAVPDKGYRFVKWSDGVTTAEHDVIRIEENIQITAEFELITREFKLNHRLDLNSEYNKQPLALTYGALDGVKLPVLEKDRFTFGGWYYDEQKIADENGNLLIDDDFLLDGINQDIGDRNLDIRAKWTAEEAYPFKILVIYVTKIEADLLDRYRNMQHVSYEMTAQQREFCHENTKLLKRTMDDMCDGLVDFQIDEYFTAQTVNTENFSQGFDNPNSTNISTCLYPSYIPEIRDASMLDGYDASVSVFGFCENIPTHDETHRFQYAAGSAKPALKGECEVYLDGSLVSFWAASAPSFTEILNGEYNDAWLAGIETYVHEIAHTIELRTHCADYHNAVHIWNPDIGASATNKLYYLNELIHNGERVGIPYEFWKGEIATVTYGVSRDNDNNMGYISGNENYDFFYSYMNQEVIYGYDALSVIAKPFTGYRFVRWSDGVTTPERKDKNVTTDLNVTAIFEPIVYTIRLVASEGGSLRKLSSSELHAEIAMTVKLRERTEDVCAVAQNGYRFVGWSDGTKSDLWSKFIQITDVDMFDENDTYVLTAIFEKIS